MIKNLVLFSIITIFLTNTVNAGTVLTDKSTYTSGETITYITTCDPGDELIVFNPAGEQAGGTDCSDLLDGYTENYFDEGVYTVVVDPYIANCSGSCYYYSDYSPFLTSPIHNFTISNNFNQTWGAAGMFGTTSMLATVARGVQDTGAPIWPLFAFLGVPLAFIIAVYLRDFIIAAGAERRKDLYTTKLAEAENQYQISKVIDQKEDILSGKIK